jgi:hypothetical protein
LIQQQKINMMRLIRNSYLPAGLTPLVLAILSFLAYGLLIPWLGLFADDWTFLWTSQILGVEGELRYFILGNNRPLWGLFYHFFINLFGHHLPWFWHIFGIFWLWLTSVLLWWLVRLVWPGHQKTAFYAAALFAVYPGFQLQLISLMVGHMWLVLACLLFSLGMNVHALRQPGRYLLFSSLAVLGSTINLLAFEYFFMLELVRPVLLWFVSAQMAADRRIQIRRTLLAWLPYALLFASVVVWRSFFFVLQTDKYQLSLMDQIRLEPLATLIGLFGSIVKDIAWDATLLPWGLSLTLPLRLDWRSMSSFAYLGLSFFAAVLVFVYLSRVKTKSEAPEAGGAGSSWQIMAAGLVFLLAAGWPFWLTGLDVAPVYWNSRFTMPFMAGTALLFSGAASLIRLPGLRYSLLAVLVGFGVGFQFQVANDFRWDWKVQTDLLRQLSWRVPGLEPGTTLFSNELPIKYYTDNTLSAQLNWIAARGQPSYRADYYLAYPSETVRDVDLIAAGQEQIQRDMMSIDYYGSLDRVVGIHYQHESCLRILDPRFDPANILMDGYNREIARLSNVDLITLEGRLFELDPRIYGPEPVDHWCYPVQLADIARQKGDWLEVAVRGDELGHLRKSLYRDPMIPFIFIEGYAHMGELTKAVEMSERVAQGYPYFERILCQLWAELDRDLGGLPGKDSSLQQMLERYDCQ